MIGTTEKVINNLHKMNADKKAQLTARYDENSLWLENELKKIRMLIGGVKEESEVVVGSFEESSRQKRKSSEASAGSVRHSPDQKRVSTDYIQLAVDAGLPADLNKLKKEHLLNEIEQRGNTSFSIKCLKKELVDALKDLLVMESLKQTESEPCEDTNNEENHSENLENCINDDSIIEGETHETAPSASDEINAESASEVEVQPEPVSEMIQNEVQIVAEDVVVNPQQALKDRMSRHRQSQARKSTAVEKNLFKKEEAVEDDAEDVATDVESLSLAEAQASNDVVDNAAPSSESSDFMDVASPVKPAVDCWQEVNSPSRTTSENVNIETIATTTTAAAVAEPVSKPIPASGKSVIASFSVSSKANNNTHSNLNPVVPTSINAPSNLVSGPSMLKKPSNLISSSAQSSFLEKPKPMVAALAQAAKLREQEEQKALQKKQLQQQKAAAAAAQSNNNNGITSASIIMKASMMTSGKSNPSNTTAPSMHSVIPSGSSKAKLQPQVVPPAPAAATSAVIASAISNPFSKATATTPTNENMMPSIAPQAPTAKPVVALSAPVAPIPATKPVPSVAPVVQKPANTTNVIAAPPVARVMPSVPAPAPAPAAGPPAMVTAAAPAPTSPEARQYEMDDMSDSDESDSGTEDEADKPEKFIPDWARSVNLKGALAKQFGLVPGILPMDPDTIFAEVQTCSLEEIFGKLEGKYGKYARRTSSAKWEHDELSLVEKRKYRNVMGYAPTSPVPSAHQ